MSTENTGKKILRWLPAIAWMLIIFLFSHQEGGGSGRLSRLVLEFLAGLGIDMVAWFGDSAMFIIRKLAHFSIYFILLLFLRLALHTHPRKIALALVIAVLYAISDEVHQLFIPKRVGDAMDVLIDSFGALAATVFLWLLSLILQKGSGNDDIHK